MSSSLPIFIQRWLSQKHFFAGVGIPFFAVFILLPLGGYRNIAILLHEARTTATITTIHTGSRGAVYYRYEVNGHTYKGTGQPDPKLSGPPLAVGDTFEIRYSTCFPSFSTAQNPLTLFGQFAVGCLFFLWADFMATRNRKKQENTAQPGTKAN